MCGVLSTLKNLYGGRFNYWNIWPYRTKTHGGNFIEMDVATANIFQETVLRTLL